jgi:hypothetical protein
MNDACAICGQPIIARVPTMCTTCKDAILKGEEDKYWDTVKERLVKRNNSPAQKESRAKYHAERWRRLKSVLSDITKWPDGELDPTPKIETMKEWRKRAKRNDQAI